MSGDLSNINESETNCSCVSGIRILIGQWARGTVMTDLKCFVKHGNSKLHFSYTIVFFANVFTACMYQF